MTATPEIKARIEYLRGEIRAERISYGEIAELESLAEYIDPTDVEIMAWASGSDTARVWSTFVGGTEVNDEYLTLKQALALGREYIEDNYTDVVVLNLDGDEHVVSL